MKKLLLSVLLGLAGTSSLFATTDGQTYETKNDLACKNLWVAASQFNSDGWQTMPWISEGLSTKVRSVCFANIDGVNLIVAGWS